MADIGHNNPPIDAREAMTQAVMALTAEVTTLVADAPAFINDEVLSYAAGLKRRCGAVLKDVDATRKTEKAPHDKAAKEVQEFFNPLLARVETAADLLSQKMQAELSRRKREKDEAERLAREEARRLELEAEKAADAAYAALEAQSTGEVSDVSYIEAKVQSIEARWKAKAAEQAASQIGNISAGIKVAGAAAVSIRTTQKVRLAFPKSADRATRAEALLQFMESMAVHRDGQAELIDLMTKLANQAFRVSKKVPPFCEVYEVDTVS